MTSAFDKGPVPEIRVHHRLRIAREWADLDQAQLAERMGISRQHVSTMESGRKEPRKIIVNAWALATGVAAQWLLTGEAPAGPSDPHGAARPTNGDSTNAGAFGQDVAATQNDAVADQNDLAATASLSRLPRVDSNHQPSG